MTWVRGAVARSIGLAVVGLGALASCRQFGSEDVALYRDLLDAGAPVVAPPHAGESLDLKTSLLLANATDEQIAVTGEAYVRAVVERRRVAARFLPEISLAPRATLREGSSTASTTRGGVDVPIEGELTVSPVTDHADLMRAGASAAAARARVLTAQDDLFLTTARAHAAVLRAERRADVIRASLVVQQARVDDAKARVAAGLKRPLDVALAESRAADARADLIVEETAAKNGRTALSFLTGWELGNTALDDRLAPVADTSDARDSVTARDSAAIRAAQTRRPELRALRQEVDAAAQAVEAAYGEYWPRVSVDLAFLLTRDSEPTELDWTSALQVSIPLFSGGRIEADVRTALSRLRESKLALSRTTRIITRDLTTTSESHRASARRLEALAVRREAAARALELAESQWNAGLATNLERLTAQDDLLSAELDLAEGALERRLLKIEWLRAAGRIRELAGLPDASTIEVPPDEPGASNAAPR